MLQKIEETSAFIKEKLNGQSPKIGIILGSGLGIFADELDNKFEIPYEEIPNFHKTTVVGHKGRLVFGSVGGVEVAVFQGRFHAYEGHPQEDVVLPVRVLGQLGIKNVMITNAAGGINADFSPGELVSITDHLNLTGNSPLLGPNEDSLGERFPDLTEAYNKELNSILAQSAKELGIPLKAGVYAGLLGPAYETPAEIKMLQIIGADMVGMSTVPEVIAANHMGLRVCGISCITNLAAGISPHKLHHDEVKEVANRVIEKFSNLLKSSIVKIGNLN